MFECVDLRCEDLQDPVGVDESNPRFSWKLSSDRKEVFQTEYEIIVDDMWHAIVKSDQCLYVKYDGLPLKSKTKYNYRVRTTNNYGDVSPFVYGNFTTGLMGEPVSGKWIGQKQRPEKVAAYINKVNCEEFKTAYIFATAYGIYEIYINGQRVGESFFTPGLTNYNKRLQYQMFDVRDYLKKGENEVKVYLGKGWCCGRYPFQTDLKGFKDFPAFILQMEIDGHTVLKSDETWKYYDSPILFSELYDGEIYDSRIENTYQNEGLAEIIDYEYDNLVWNIGSQVKVVEEIKPVRIFKTPYKQTVIDFGQNMAGWAEFSGSGKSGDIISFSHAETLDSSGNFYNENFRTAQNDVTFILNGTNNQKYHPHFAFEGFRYIRIDKCTFDISLENFTGKVISSINTTSRIDTSNENLNRLFKNVLWSQKGNFIDVPTDCPQRDERVAWTGDAQVFISTALKNANCLAFYKKWLLDMKTEQTDDGLVQIFIPAIREKQTSSAWGDSATICPWELYKASNDRDFLFDIYPMMKKWVNYIKKQGNSPFLWNDGFQLGDWLALDSTDGSYEGTTDKYYIATAFFAYSTIITSKAAKALGLYEDEKELLHLFENIKKEFLKTYTDEYGMPYCKTQTAYVLGLFMNLFEDKKRAAKELNELIIGNGTKLTTGFVGTPYLCFALSQNGYIETAYKLLLQEEYPSWLYSVKQGATTIWEHWDGIKPDGSMWSKNMNSFNHYAYGSIADWIFSEACGIKTDEDNVGYKNSIIAPKPYKGLKKCFAEFDTSFGKIASGWEYINNNKIKITINIPCNTTSKIILPDGKEFIVKSGEYSWEIYN